MKKIVGMLVVAGIVFGLMPVAAIADCVLELDEDAAIGEEAGVVKGYKNRYQVLFADKGSSGQERIRNLARNRIGDDNGPKQDIASKDYAKVRGVWGLAGDNESDGYFGGKIVRRGRFSVFNGLYNKTDNETFGKFVGIFKRGYFLGKVVNPNGESCRIIGLYNVDKEEMIFKMRWMTPQLSGWAAGKIIPVED